MLTLPIYAADKWTIKVFDFTKTFGFWDEMLQDNATTYYNWTDWIKNN